MAMSFTTIGRVTADALVEDLLELLTAVPGPYQTWLRICMPRLHIPCQKSGRSAVGTAALSIPRSYPTAFSAQTNSGHCPKMLNGRQ
jgi:hypothetical protein